MSAFTIRERFLLAVFLVIVVLALASCSSLPPRDVYVAWRGPCSGEQAQVVRVRFVDTQAPVMACVQSSLAEGDVGPLLLTLLGAPPAACTVSYLGMGHATIYASISPGPSQILAAVLTLRPPEELMMHEIGHAFHVGHFGCE